MSLQVISGCDLRLIGRHFQSENQCYSSDTSKYQRQSNKNSWLASVQTTDLYMTVNAALTFRCPDSKHHSVAALLAEKKTQNTAKAHSVTTAPFPY